jgi:hypothetical protein
MDEPSGGENWRSLKRPMQVVVALLEGRDPCQGHGVWEPSLAA